MIDVTQASTRPMTPFAQHVLSVNECAPNLHKWVRMKCSTFGYQKCELPGCLRIWQVEFSLCRLVFDWVEISTELSNNRRNSKKIINLERSVSFSFRSSSLIFNDLENSVSVRRWRSNFNFSTTCFLLMLSYPIAINWSCIPVAYHHHTKTTQIKIVDCTIRMSKDIWKGR